MKLVRTIQLVLCTLPLLDQAAHATLNSATKALHKALKEHQSLEIIKQHLHAKVDINARDEEKNQNALHIALAANCKTATFFCLLEKAHPGHSFILNQQNDNGESVLFLATQQLKKKIVAYLIEQGADTLLRNKKNQTPLEFLLNDYWRLYPDNWQLTKDRYLEVLRLLARGMAHQFSYSTHKNILILVYSHEDTFSEFDAQCLDILRDCSTPPQHTSQCLPIRFIRRNIPITQFKVTTYDEFNTITRFQDSIS